MKVKDITREGEVVPFRRKAPQASRSSMAPEPPRLGDPANRVMWIRLRQTQSEPVIEIMWNRGLVQVPAMTARAILNARDEHPIKFDDRRSEFPRWFTVRRDGADLVFGGRADDGKGQVVDLPDNMRVPYAEFAKRAARLLQIK